jgi:molybdopterin-guanine dinucleotide biosynthesis protein A
LQPLCAVYARALLPSLEAPLARGERALVAAVRALDPHVVSAAALAVEDPDLAMLASCNTPEEYRAALARAGL